MNRNPLIPFAIIAILGIGAMFLVSFKGLGDMNDLASEGEEAPVEETASADPEELYQQNCIACHGDQYQGGMGPALSGVGEKLSEDEIIEILTNGKGAMPGGLVAGKEADMAAWLAEIK
ncbi:cytochrome c [Bacillus sp. CRN 9]|nr:cytochrome c [Bacillus sp. CRN 9]